MIAMSLGRPAVLELYAGLTMIELGVFTWASFARQVAMFSHPKAQGKVKINITDGKNVSCCMQLYWAYSSG